MNRSPFDRIVIRLWYLSEYVIKFVWNDYRIKEQPANSGSRCVPTIQMTGHWLRKAGFTIDAPLTIQVREGCLVITVAAVNAANE